MFTKTDGLYEIQKAQTKASFNSRSQEIFLTADALVAPTLGHLAQPGLLEKGTLSLPAERMLQEQKVRSCPGEGVGEGWAGRRGGWWAEMGKPWQPGPTAPQP